MKSNGNSFLQLQKWGENREQSYAQSLIRVFLGFGVFLIKIIQ